MTILNVLNDAISEFTNQLRSLLELNQTQPKTCWYDLIRSDISEIHTAFLLPGTEPMDSIYIGFLKVDSLAMAGSKTSANVCQGSPKLKPLTART
jgi:hypothetical protein